MFKENYVGTLTGDFVKYVNRDSYNGEMGAFRKFEKFSYQREYRYVWEGDNLNASTVTLTVGNLSDIAALVPSEKINSLITIPG